MTRAKAKTWMTAREFEATIVQLDMSWAEAARRFDISYMSMHRMRRGDQVVPRPIAELLRCWTAHGLPAA